MKSRYLISNLIFILIITFSLLGCATPKALKEFEKRNISVSEIVNYSKDKVKEAVEDVCVREGWEITKEKENTLFFTGHANFFANIIGGFFSSELGLAEYGKVIMKSVDEKKTKITVVAMLKDAVGGRRIGDPYKFKQVSMTILHKIKYELEKSK